MPDYKDILKHGWHPEKQGTSLKGQMKSLVGRGEDTSRTNHAAAPLSSLRDPASFAPPPKRNPNAFGGPASPATPSSPASHTGPSVPPRGAATAAEPEPDEPPAAPKPWRLDTTGLSTAHLPPPPGRRDGADGRPPPPPSAAVGNSAGRPAPPSLPPRLPPRSASTSPAVPSRSPTHSPGPSQGYLNQSAVNRLGAAGISVPGLGITPTANTHTGPATPPPPQYQLPAARSPTVATPPQHQATGSSHMNELQSRFARLKTNTPTPSTQDTSAAAAAATVAAAAAKKKPPPPPPPKKKPGLMASTVGGAGSAPASGSGFGFGGGDEEAPPPVPMATRPRF